MTPNGDVARWCDNRGVEITWAPVRARGRTYCCLACRRGEACDCPAPLGDEDREIAEPRRADVERTG